MPTGDCPRFQSGSAGSYSSCPTGTTVATAMQIKVNRHNGGTAVTEELVEPQNGGIDGDATTNGAAGLVPTTPKNVTVGGYRRREQLQGLPLRDLARRGVRFRRRQHAHDRGRLRRQAQHQDAAGRRRAARPQRWPDQPRRAGAEQRDLGLGGRCEPGRRRRRRRLLRRGLRHQQPALLAEVLPLRHHLRQVIQAEPDDVARDPPDHRPGRDRLEFDDQELVRLQEHEPAVGERLPLPGQRPLDHLRRGIDEDGQPLHPRPDGSRAAAGGRRDRRPGQPLPLQRRRLRDGARQRRRLRIELAPALGLRPRQLAAAAHRRLPELGAADQHDRRIVGQRGQHPHLGNRRALPRPSSSARARRASTSPVAWRSTSGSRPTTRRARARPARASSASP